MNGTESAFPHVWKNNDGSEDWTHGMNKREYFAAVAMNGILSRPGNWDKADLTFVSKEAVYHADQLLKELEK